MSPIEAAGVVLVVLLFLWADLMDVRRNTRRGMYTRENQIHHHLHGAQTSFGTLKRIRHMETARALMVEEAREAAERERTSSPGAGTNPVGGQRYPEPSGGAGNPRPRGPAIETIDDLAELSEPATRLWWRGDEAVYLVGDSAILTAEHSSGEETSKGEPQGRRLQLYTFASTSDLEAFARPRGWLDGAQAHLPAALALSLRGMVPSLPSIEWESHDLVVRRDHEVSARRPSPAEWDAFWDRADQLGVWEWGPSYRAEQFATDRLGWHLVLAYGGRLAVSSGYGAFPPAGKEDPRPLESLFAALGIELFPEL